MAKIRPAGCEGCGRCCRGMGDTIHLDPYDLYRFETGFGSTFTDLLNDKIALHVEDGMILPHLLMQEDTDACGFLDAQGRCEIHEDRPGICRLFPLGRNYDGEGFRYFAVEQEECPPGSMSKVKISKWLDIPDLNRYEKYIATWHYFVRKVQERLSESDDENYNRQINMFLLQTFFVNPYGSEEDFHETFAKRMAQAKAVLGA